MIDLKGIRSLTVEYTDLKDLLARTTNNPLMEDMIPDLLLEALRKGIPVFVTAREFGEIYNLVGESGKFKLELMK